MHGFAIVYEKIPDVCVVIDITDDVLTRDNINVLEVSLTPDHKGI